MGLQFCASWSYLYFSSALSAQGKFTLQGVMVFLTSFLAAVGALITTYVYHTIVALAAGFGFGSFLGLAIFLVILRVREPGFQLRLSYDRQIAKEIARLGATSFYPYRVLTVFANRTDRQIIFYSFSQALTGGYGLACRPVEILREMLTSMVETMQPEVTRAVQDGPKKAADVLHRNSLIAWAVTCSFMIVPCSLGESTLHQWIHRDLFEYQGLVMLAMALARLRQLAAHEVGHTLGLEHNYIASTVGRASVMDYPAPLALELNDSTLDISKAYATGIGEWDKVAIAFGYQDFPQGVNEKEACDAILMKAAARGITFLTDQDARPQGSCHPSTHLWDNGVNAVDELARILKIRAVGLSRFGEHNIRPGAPMATLEDVLVPLYMGHRYQVEAAAKVLGGLTYTAAMRGDGQITTAMIPPFEQRRALVRLLSTLEPDVLALPERILSIIPPRPVGYERGREHVRIKTGLTFDPLSAAESAADLTVSVILHPARAARLVEYHARDAKYPGLEEVIERLLSSTWRSDHGTGYAAEVRRTVDGVVLTRLLGLAGNPAASTQARAIAHSKLMDLKTWVERQAGVTKDADQKALYRFAASQIRRYEADPKSVIVTPPAEMPDGPPIGGDDLIGQTPEN